MITKKFIQSLCIEFGPIVAFFLGTELVGFFTGTALLLGGTILALIASLHLDGRVPIFSLISSACILVLGGVTLYQQDAYWLVLEYTLYNGLFGIALLGGLVTGKCLLKPLFQQMFHISDRGWLILSLRWSFFFILTAVLNEYVWRYHGEDMWVYFRLSAGVGLSFFGFSQFFLARKERLPGSSAWGLRM